MRASSHPTNAHLGAGVFNHTLLEWADELAAVRAEVVSEAATFDGLHTNLAHVTNELREATMRGYAKQDDAVKCEQGLSMILFQLASLKTRLAPEGP